MAETKFEVKIGTEAGARYGTYSLGKIAGTVPIQAPTSTNMNHLTPTQKKSVDYGSRIMEVFLWVDPAELSDVTVYRKELKKLKGWVENHPDMLCLVHIQGAKSKRITHQVNRVFVQLQVAAGMKFVKAYFKTKKDALKRLQEYLEMLPEDCYLVPVLDENIEHETFRELYEVALGKTPIIGFLGRRPTAKGRDVLKNIGFIQRRSKDNVVRMVSEIPKKTANQAAESFFRRWLGFDVYSFATKRGSFQRPIEELEFFHGLQFVKLRDNGSVPCVLTPGNTVMQSVKTYSGPNKSVPCSARSIVSLNDVFKRLGKEIEEKGIHAVLEQDIKNFSDALGALSQ